ncbi:MAG: DEAD/DEAH box helicase [Acidobacteria bacterium]|nr:DEAD/DEAH box helicase [Acidobacteriota bacterium]
MAFSSFGLKEFITANLKVMGYEQPTEIQGKAIPEIINKRDAVIESKTGSGKTAAFGIPVVQSVSPDVPAVQYLILVPARELALQVYRELSRLAEGSSVNVTAVYGGSSFSKQVDALKKGAHVVVGTPGRVLDHLKRRTMSVSVVRGLVLDEADKMLSMGFLPEMRLIFQHLPKRHQTIMSSATFPPAIEHLIHSLMHEPVRLSQEDSSRAPAEIEHLYCMTTMQEKDQVLLRFIEKEEPELSIVFCNTKVDVRAVAQFLSGAGIKAVYLSSDLSQAHRERNLSRFRLGLVQVLVCTDLAARGIDVPNVSHVFIYATSEDLETYVHRSGRTGRAGKSGRAISLVSGTDIANFNLALKAHSIKATEVPIPTDEEIIEARVASEHRVLEDIGYAKDADVHDDYLRLAERLTADQAHTLLPFLLEKFLRQGIGEPLDITSGGGAVTEAEQSAAESSSFREPREKKRRDRDRPSRTKTLCVALGRRDGLSPNDLRSTIKKAARLRKDDLMDIQMGEYESTFQINANAVKYVMKANGKFYRQTEILISEA